MSFSKQLFTVIFEEVREQMSASGEDASFVCLNYWQFK